MSFVNINGEPLDMRALAAKAPAQRAIVGSKRKPTIPRGYAALPGTGPEGKTCRDCKHKQTQSNTGNKSWIKCELMRAAWTHGPGSDIRAGSPACRRFEPKTLSALSADDAGGGRS
jgi:hypothetical protein